MRALHVPKSARQQPLVGSSAGRFLSPEAMRLSPTMFALGATDGRFWVSRHIQLIEEYLMALVSRKIRRLIVECPPRHGKSWLISHYFPAWFLGTFPDEKIIHATYASTFSEEWGAKVRDSLIEFGPSVFGVKLRGNSASQVAIQGHEGVMYTAGVGGPITGRGANLLIIDDPVKNAAEALSSTYREKAWNWWDTTASTRLEPDGIAVVLMTRWHEDDLAGRLIKTNNDDDTAPEMRWHVLRLPAIADGLGDLLGRAEGEALWPERWPAETLLARKSKMRPQWWSAMFQQEPVSDAGAILKRTYWIRKPYAKDEAGRYIIPGERFRILAIDSAFKDREQNDFQAIGAWCVTDTEAALVDLWHERATFPDVERQLLYMIRKWQPHRVIIEDKASGQDLLPSLKKYTGIPIVAMPADVDKVRRTHVVSAFFEAGRVVLPDDAPYADKVIEETHNFPLADHDDIHDMVVHATTYIQRRLSASVGTSHGLRERASARQTTRDSITDNFY